MQFFSLLYLCMMESLVRPVLPSQSRFPLTPLSWRCVLFHTLEALQRDGQPPGRALPLLVHLAPVSPSFLLFFVRQLWLTFTSGTLGTNMSDTYIGDVPRPALPTVVIDRWVVA